MATLEQIIEQARALSPAEKRKLRQVLDRELEQPVGWNHVLMRAPGLSAIVTNTWASGLPSRAIRSLPMELTLGKFI